MATSSAVYVSATDRTDGTRGQLPLRSVNSCDHGNSVCVSWDCIAGWANDWSLNLDRTILGRRMIEELAMTPEEVASLT